MLDILTNKHQVSTLKESIRVKFDLGGWRLYLGNLSDQRERV